METSAALNEYVYAKVNWSRETRRVNTIKLTQFVTWARGEQVTDTSGLSAALANRYYGVLQGRGLASASLHGHGLTLRGWYGWLASEEVLDERTLKRFVIPKKERRVKPTLELDEMSRLFATAEHNRSARLAARDLALLMVLCDTGMRASECVGLKLDGVVLNASEGYLRVFGKGAKWRECGIGRKARSALVRYLTRYRQAAEGVDAVFVGRSGLPLTIRGLEALVDRLAARAGLGRKLYPHLLRHGYARHFLAQGGDPVRLSRLLGHESLQITMEYLRDVRASEARQGASILDAMTKGR